VNFREDTLDNNRSGGVNNARAEQERRTRGTRQRGAAARPNGATVFTYSQHDNECE
jgi:hypothetical protein